MRLVKIVTILAMALPNVAFAQTGNPKPSEPSNSSIPTPPGQSAPKASSGEPVSGSRTMGMNPENRRQDKPGDKAVPALGKEKE